MKQQSAVDEINLTANHKSGRPLLLGKLDEKVQEYLQMICKKGGIVNTDVAIAIAKANFKQR